MNRERIRKEKMSRSRMSKKKMIKGKHNNRSDRSLFKQKKFLIIMIFWILIVGLVIAFNENILRNGEEVYLKSTPVDPIDLFRGDYMNLRYEISGMDPDIVSIPEDLLTDEAIGKDIYLRLHVDDKGVASPIAVLKNPPKQGLFIKGKIKSVDPYNLGVDYGIESYFIPERTGNAWPRITEVKIAIDDKGNSRIKGVYNNFKEINPEDINP